MYNKRQSQPARNGVGLSLVWWWMGFTLPPLHYRHTTTTYCTYTCTPPHAHTPLLKALPYTAHTTATPHHHYYTHYTTPYTPARAHYCIACYTRLHPLLRAPLPAHYTTPTARRLLPCTTTLHLFDTWKHFLAQPGPILLLPRTCTTLHTTCTAPLRATAARIPPNR